MKKSIMSRFTVHPKAKAPVYYDEGWNLGAVYGSYSYAKANAWDYCVRLCDEVNGTGLAVRGHNTFAFTANFFFINPENGREMMAVITRDYNHAYYID